MQSTTIRIALGGNIPGHWGDPKQTFERAIREIEHAGLAVVARSGLFLTRPVGRAGQPDYLNAVVAVRGAIAPAALLRLLKRIETAAGRRVTGRWGPRPLDLDILDFGGRILGNPSRARVRGSLVLPHPEMEDRAFVLTPLVEVSPKWQHPRLDASARTLALRIAGQARGIRRLGEWGSA